MTALTMEDIGWFIWRALLLYFLLFSCIMLRDIQEKLEQIQDDISDVVECTCDVKRGGRNASAAPVKRDGEHAE